jgi:tetratricopeptide (TPR) repeat protein
MCAIAQADPIAELDDAAGRMQYAFYTSDAAGLRLALDAASAVDAAGALAPLKEYALAYGRWKLAIVLSTAPPASPGKNTRSEALKSAEDCRSGLDRVLEKNDHSAEAYALRAACDQVVQRLSLIAGMTGSSCESNKFLKRALELAPHNPRVLLIHAQCIPDRSDKPNPVALSAVRAAATAFDEHGSSAPGEPDWGHAEALYELGKMSFVRGDQIAARNALESALVLNPDYVAASALLRQVSTAR